MSNLDLFDLAAGEYGWSAAFPPGSPCLFGKEISLEIHTRMTPNDPPTLPPISASQASLVDSIIPVLPSLVQRVEIELEAYSKEFNPEFQKVISHPHVWLNSENDDGLSWTFVVERSDAPDFGYHAEFKGTEFVELWAGD
jgi:hypothetical protein